MYQINLGVLVYVMCVLVQKLRDDEAASIAIIRYDHIAIVKSTFEFFILQIV